MKIIFTILILFSLVGINAQIQNGIIAHFPFNNSVADISNSTIVASNNGANFVADRNGVANFGLDLGTGQSVSFNDNAVKVPLPITICVWVQMSSFAETNYIFTASNDYNNYYGYWINTELSTGRVNISIAGGLGGQNLGNRRTFTSDGALQIGVWHHVVGIINSYNDMEIYIDCVKQTGSYSGTGSMTIAYSNADSFVGYNIGNSSAPAGTHFEGNLDQFVIWNRELTANEILFMCDSLNTLDTPEILSQSNDNMSLNAYPNPSESNVIISFGKVLEAPELFIYNTVGELVYSEKSLNLSEIELNIEKMASGTYIAKVTDNNNSGFVRFVKE